jgi:hypothetical protein
MAMDSENEIFITFLLFIVHFCVGGDDDDDDNNNNSSSSNSNNNI